MKFSARIKKNLRLWVQVAFTALSNGYLLGFAKGKIYQGASKQICVPGLNCFSCPGAVASCPIGSLQAVIATKQFSFSFYVIGFLMMVGAFAGRFACGWLCPFGLIQDLLYKIPLVKKIKRVPFDGALRYLKYVILAVFVFALPLLAVSESGYGTPWFCEFICPSGTLMAGIPLVAANSGLRQAAGLLFGWKTLLLLTIIVLSVLIYRPFCRYLCPLGAIYGIFNRFSLYRYEIDKEQCTGCGKCAKACKMEVKVWQNPNSAECIRCGECIKHCPEQAIHSTFHRSGSSLSHKTEKNAETKA